MVDRSPRPHPLDPLSADEVATVTRLLLEGGRVGRRPAFVWVAVEEPPKGAVASGSATGTVPERRASAVVVDRADGSSLEAVVSLTRGVVERVTALDGLHAPFLDSEWREAEETLRADPGVRDALARRGVTDLGTVQVFPWPAAFFDEPFDHSGHRLARAVLYVRERAIDNTWARPVEDLVVIYDRTTGEVLEIRDDRVLPVPAASGPFATAEATGRRDDLRALEVVQRDGPSFALEGHELRWQRWRMHVAMHPIEGLVLHTVGYEDSGRVRSILHRASLAELVVPYGDPSPMNYWKHVFDAGEAGMGRNACSLELGCDCLGEIRYLDAVMVEEDGRPRVVPNAICVHEEDDGILWRHHDLYDGGVREVRRRRRLVVSYWCTQSNYDYGFFWRFYQDGSLECEVRLTGVVITKAAAPGEQPSFAEWVDDALAAPHHQHLFCFRLDLDVDGTANTVEEVDVRVAPAGPGNPHANAFGPVTTPLRTERAARRDANPGAGRYWRVVNPHARNRFGRPVAYRVLPDAGPVLLAGDGAAVRRRAAFAEHTVWVTPLAPDELRAAGPYPTQHPGGAGLPQWTAADRSVDDADVVVWLTCGATHVTRPEDWPVMPVARTGFRLEPDGFFDRNPGLDVPPQEMVNGHACPS